MERRRFLATASTTSAIGLAGCLDALQDEENDDVEQEESGPAATLESFLRTSFELETNRREYYHSLTQQAPLELRQLDTTVAERGLDTADLAERLSVDEATVAAELGSADTAVVRATIELLDGDEQERNEDEWLLATDGKAWKILESVVGGETQSEETGTESTEQVADALNVLTTVGTVGTDETIRELRIGVKPAASADEINLAELTLQYVSEEASANIVVGNQRGTGEMATGATPPDDVVVAPESGETQYGIDVVSAATPDDVVMTDTSDRYELVVPLAPAPDSESDAVNPELTPLPTGAEAELTITTEVGAQTVAFLQVPETLSGQESGDTVNL